MPRVDLRGLASMGEVVVSSLFQDQSSHESWVEGQKAEDAYRNSHVKVRSVLQTIIVLGYGSIATNAVLSTMD